MRRKKAALAQRKQHFQMIGLATNSEAVAGGQNDKMHRLQPWCTNRRFRASWNMAPIPPALRHRASNSTSPIQRVRLVMNLPLTPLANGRADSQRPVYRRS